MSKTRHTPTLALCLAAAALASCGGPPSGAPAGGPPQMPPPPVTFKAIEPKAVTPWEEFTGRADAMETVELRPRVSGYVTEVHFQAGQLVKKEDVLFVIDPRSYEAKASQARAELARAEAAAATAEREFQRVKGLVDAKAMTREEAESRESLRTQAAAGVQAAKALVQNAQLDLEWTAVRAPISGRISRAMITPGNYVSGQAGAASLLATIVTTDPVYIYADIDENTLLRLQKAMAADKIAKNKDGKIPAEAQLADETGYPHQGWIESLDNRLDPGTGSLALRTVFPNADGRFQPGLFARLRLPLGGSEPVLMIDDAAIKTDQSSKFVYVLSDKGTADYRKIVPGALHEGQRVIVSGLTKGDKVIVNGLSKIFMPGMPVAATPWAPEKPAAQ